MQITSSELLLVFFRQAIIISSKNFPRKLVGEKINRKMGIKLNTTDPLFAFLTDVPSYPLKMIKL